MTLPVTQPQRLSQLLWCHYRWHLGIGLAIWSSVVFPVIIFKYLKNRSFILHTPFYTDNQADAISRSDNDYAWLTIIATSFVFAAAAFGGLVRHYLLASLSRTARTHGELVWKSLLGFELSVALAASVPLPVAYNRFSPSMAGHQLLIYFLLSLPWLIATGLASHKLAAKLALPRA